MSDFLFVLYSHYSAHLELLHWLMIVLMIESTTDIIWGTRQTMGIIYTVSQKRCHSAFLHNVAVR